MKGHDLSELRVDGVGRRADQLAGRPVLAGLDIVVLPSPIGEFLFGIRKGPALRRSPIIASPWLGREAGPVALLHFAKLTVERIGAERFESLLHDRRGNITRSVSGEQANTRLGPVDPPL